MFYPPVTHARLSHHLIPPSHTLKGNFQDPNKMKGDQEERTRFSRFYYRFPNGEAGSDVLIRVSILCDGLIRDMAMGKYQVRCSGIRLETHVKFYPPPWGPCQGFHSRDCDAWIDIEDLSHEMVQLVSRTE